MTHSNNQTKTKNQKDRQAGLNSYFNFKGIKYLLLIIGASLILIAPFVHMEFSRSNPVVDDLRKELNINVQIIEKDISKLKEDYKNKNISAEHYIQSLENKITEKNKVLNENYNLVKLKEDQNRFFGWKTIRKFLIGFGIRLPYLLFAIIISFLIYKINTKDKSLSRFFFYLQVVCYTSAIYQVVWCFWYSQDFPLEVYRITAVCICGFVALASVYFITYREVFKLRLLKIVENNNLAFDNLKLSEAFRDLLHLFLKIRSKKVDVNDIEVEAEFFNALDKAPE